MQGQLVRLITRAIIVCGLGHTPRLNCFRCVSNRRSVAMVTGGWWVHKTGRLKSMPDKMPIADSGDAEVEWPTSWRIGGGARSCRLGGKLVGGDNVGQRTNCPVRCAYARRSRARTPCWAITSQIRLALGVLVGTRLLASECGCTLGLPFVAARERDRSFASLMSSTLPFVRPPRPSAPMLWRHTAPSLEKQALGRECISRRGPLGLGDDAPQEA